MTEQFDVLQSHMREKQPSKMLELPPSLTPTVRVPKATWDKLVRVAEISWRDYIALTTGDSSNVASGDEWLEAIEDLKEVSSNV